MSTTIHTWTCDRGDHFVCAKDYRTALELRYRKFYGFTEFPPKVSWNKSSIMRRLSRTPESTTVLPSLPPDRVPDVPIAPAVLESLTYWAEQEIPDPDTLVCHFNLQDIRPSGTCVSRGDMITPEYLELSLRAEFQEVQSHFTRPSQDMRELLSLAWNEHSTRKSCRDHTFRAQLSDETALYRRHEIGRQLYWELRTQRWVPGENSVEVERDRYLLQEQRIFNTTLADSSLRQPTAQELQALLSRQPGAEDTGLRDQGAETESLADTLV